MKKVKPTQKLRNPKGRKENAKAAETDTEISKEKARDGKTQRQNENKTINRCLSLAAANGHTGIIQKLVQAGGDVDWKSGNVGARTPLLLAAENGYDLAVAELVDSGAKIEATDDDGLTALHLASRRNHPGTVRCLLSKGADKNGGSCADSPIHLAAKNGSLSAVKELRKGNVGLNEGGSGGKRPLHLAAENGHVLVVEELLDAGVDVSVYTNHERNTPLHFAAMKNHLEILERLLNAGADPNATAQKHRRPLHYAAEKGHAEIVRGLLQFGAFEDPTLESTRSTPLHLACYSGHLACVERLLEYGADLRRTGTIPTALKDCTPLQMAYRHPAVLKTLLENGAPIDLGDKDKNTPLALAARHGCQESLQLLIDREANPNIKNNQGQSALLEALEKSKDKRDMDTIEKLIAAPKVDVNLQTNTGQTALHYAARDGEASLMENLIKRNAKVNVEASNGWTPLHYAARSAKSECVRLILKHKPQDFDIDSETEIGWTALHFAARTGKVDSMQSLLGDGADIDAATHLGWKPFHFAILQDEVGAIRFLLDRGVSMGYTDAEGLTWLHFLAQYGAGGNIIERIQLLLEKGAEIEAATNSGVTPLHLTTDAEVAKYLLERGANIEATSLTGKTVLTRAIDNEALGITMLLLDRPGTDVNTRGAYGNSWTPLHWAASAGTEAVVHELLAKGADKKTAPTVLQLAASRGHVDIIKPLQDLIDDNPDGYWGTPLQAAIQNGHTIFAEKLLDEGANANSEDEHGWTPALCALKRKNTSLLERLCTAGASHEEKDTQRPSSWSTIHKPNELRLENHNLDAILDSSKCPLGGQDKRKPPTCLLRANHPVPFQNTEFYFEITVLGLGEHDGYGFSSNYFSCTC